MHRFLVALLLLSLPMGSLASASASGHVAKVLPLYLDLQGKDAISPSLFDRDAYQSRLRQHGDQVSAIRFDVLSAAASKDAGLKLRVEVRGVGEHGLPTQAVLERDIKSNFFRRWSSLTLGADDFKNLGTLIAWRVTLWHENQKLDEQTSFLW